MIRVFSIKKKNLDIFTKIAWNVRHGSKEFKPGASAFVCLETNLFKVSYNSLWIYSCCNFFKSYIYIYIYIYIYMFFMLLFSIKNFYHLY